jgi:hypothetical protein
MLGRKVMGGRGEGGRHSSGNWLLLVERRWYGEEQRGV